MKVAIVCRGCGEGGSVARVALRHARELSRFHEAVLVSDSFPEGVQPFVCAQVRVHRFGWLRRFAHVPHELSFARASRRMLETLKPLDFVFVHSHVVADRAARRVGVPFGLVAHGDVFDRPAGTYDPLLTRLYAQATPRAYRAADVVFAISPHMRERAIAGGADPARISLVPNGIDAADLGLPATRVERSGALELLYVGRLAVEKGVDVLIDGCIELARRGVDLHLTIVGDGPLAAALRTRAEPLGQQVVFRGALPLASLGTLYASADLTCVPSRSEALPGVVIESLAAGTPVLASDIGPNTFLVEHGRNGLIVPVDSAVAIADAIQSLDRDALRQLASGTAGTLEKFSWTAIGERLAEVIRPFGG